MTEPDRSTLAAEAFGAFALVFAGMGAIVMNEASGGAITHVGIAMSFGWIVLAITYAIGDVSVCRCVQAPGCCGGVMEEICS